MTNSKPQSKFNLKTLSKYAITILISVITMVIIGYITFGEKIAAYDQAIKDHDKSITFLQAEIVTLQTTVNTKEPKHSMDRFIGDYQNDKANRQRKTTNQPTQ